MGTKFGGNYPAVNRGNKREQLMFVAAAGLAFSLLMVLLVVFNLRKAEAGNTNAEIPNELASTMVGTVTLYTSDTYVKAGTPLQALPFREVYWPRSSVPDGAVLDLRELQSNFARVDIPVGVPIQRSHITQEKAAPISLPITPGMRAVTIQVDAESGIEGFAKPGTRVDIVLTYMNDGNLTSKVIVQNARILSKGGETQKEEEDLPQRRAKVAPTVTLEVSPADALKVTTSKQLGSLSLFMRAGEDDKAAPVVEVSKQQIDGGLKKKGSERNCNKGAVRIEGKEYMIDCSGSITPIDDSLEP